MVKISGLALGMVQELKHKGWKVGDITSQGDIMMCIERGDKHKYACHKVWISTAGFIAGPWWSTNGFEVNPGRYASYGEPGVPCDRLKRKGAQKSCIADSL